MQYRLGTIFGPILGVYTNSILIFILFKSHLEAIFTDNNTIELPTRTCFAVCKTWNGFLSSETMNEKAGIFGMNKRELVLIPTRNLAMRLSETKMSPDDRNRIWQIRKNLVGKLAL